MWVANKMLGRGSGLSPWRKPCKLPMRLVLNSSVSGSQPFAIKSQAGPSWPESPGAEINFLRKESKSVISYGSGVFVEVAVGGDVLVGVADGGTVLVEVRDGVRVNVGVMVCVALGVVVRVLVGVMLGVSVGGSVAVGVGVSVIVGVGEAVGVSVAVGGGRVG
jgi:hypothetical protein